MYAISDWPPTGLGGSDQNSLVQPSSGAPNCMIPITQSSAACLEEGTRILLNFCGQHRKAFILRHGSQHSQAEFYREEIKLAAKKECSFGHKPGS